MVLKYAPNFRMVSIIFIWINLGFQNYSFFRRLKMNCKNFLFLGNEVSFHLCNLCNFAWNEKSSFINILENKILNIQEKRKKIEYSQIFNLDFAKNLNFLQNEQIKLIIFFTYAYFSFHFQRNSNAL